VQVYDRGPSVVEVWADEAAAMGHAVVVALAPASASREARLASVAAAVGPPRYLWNATLVADGVPTEGGEGPGAGEGVRVSGGRRLVGGLSPTLVVSLEGVVLDTPWALHTGYGLRVRRGLTTL
jgi:hypothetical protein